MGDFLYKRHQVSLKPLLVGLRLLLMLFLNVTDRGRGLLKLSDKLGNLCPSCHQFFKASRTFT